MNKKRAVILFTESPVKEAGIKFNFRKSHSVKIIDVFLSGIFNIIGMTKRDIHFDFIISSEVFSKKHYKMHSIHLPQRGNTFGSRFENTIRDIFDNQYDEVIIIGNDCVDLNSNKIVEAFEKLKFNDIVIGPSSDGGFYLLGLKQFNADIFKNIEWQTTSVTAQLLSNITEGNKSFEMLTELKDIDSSADLFEWLKTQSAVFSNLYWQIMRIIADAAQIILDIFLICASKAKYFLLSNRPPPSSH